MTIGGLTQAKKLSKLNLTLRHRCWWYILLPEVLENRLLDLANQLGKVRGFQWLLDTHHIKRPPGLQKPTK